MSGNNKTTAAESNSSNIGVQSAAGLPPIPWSDFFALRLLHKEFTENMTQNQTRLLQGKYALDNKLYKSEAQRVEIDEIVKDAMKVQPMLDKWADFTYNELQRMQKHIDNIMNVRSEATKRQIANAQQDFRNELLKKEANQDIVKAAEETVKNKGKTPPVPPNAGTNK